MTETRRGSARPGWQLLWMPVVAAAIAALAVDVHAGGPVAATRDDSAADCSPPQLGRGTGEGRNDPVLFPPTVGELRIALLFVDFADVRGTTDPGALYDTHIPPVVEWYRKVSYDRLQLVVTPLRRWLTLPGTAAEYAADYENGLRTTVDDALAADVDFGGFQGTSLASPISTMRASRSRSTRGT